MSDDNSKLVYSTDRPVSRKSITKKTDEAGQSHAQQKIVVKLERKGRGGKSVTVIEGLKLSKKKREGLLRQLKSKLGTGGTLKGSLLEIQGDRRDEIMTALKQTGYSPKRSGG